jgi:hypothetical protein
MTAAEKLLAWHANWTISEATVRCRLCMAAQFEHQREDVFPHLPSCSRSRSSARPWLELDEIRSPFGPAIRKYPQSAPEHLQEALETR